MYPGVVKTKSESSEGQCLGARQCNLVCLFRIGEKTITLMVQRQNEQDLYYMMGKNDRFKFMMMDYCRRMRLGLGTIHFVGPDGDTLKETQTPLDLGMEDGDVIDAFSHQLSG